MSKNYLCIHGHFYQPPRENPWIEEIECQDNVGGGYHDWNERICFECYHPNALARIIDPYQNIANIVNNFESLSFNVGPTLLSWMERHEKRTYDRILEADKNSVRRHSGHGNAIAQVYNHIIMPLANRRDKVTQVKWGIADFKKRFGRLPESMWLPETACNEESLEVLIEEGMKFVILAPQQADKIRPIGSNNWEDVSSGNVDPTRPYRYFLSSDPKKSIDIFFYDGPISKSVAFDDLVRDARIYAARLESAKDPNRKHVGLINLATDGETYGHHKAFGDRALAYLLEVEAAQHGFTITNYAEFLANFPPAYEVKIKSGDNNLGTSWSCPHGVKRWMEHCGCRGDGPGAWRQDWRKPLRETFDWLRDEIAVIFAAEGSKYFKDAWEARNGYIEIVLDRSPNARKHFFQKYASHALSVEETVTALKLLEMQRNGMLMYTSCGWFFTELSGEETVQIMTYATRAVQLAESIGSANLSDEFLRRLSRAKSNIDYFRDGQGVYDFLIRPSVVTLEKVVGHVAISSLFMEHKEKFSLYCYDVQTLDHRKESLEDLTLCFGRAKVRSNITLEETDAVYVLLQSELYDFYCYVKPFEEIPEYYEIGHQLFNEFSLGHRNQVGKIINEHFGREYFSLKDLFRDEKRKILESLSKEGIAGFREFYQELYRKYRRMFDVYRTVRVPLPEEYRFAAEYKLSDDFNKLVNERILIRSDIFDKAYAIRVLAKESGLKLNRIPSQQFLTRRLNKNMADLLVRWDGEKVKDCCLILKAASGLGIDINTRIAQENYLIMVHKLESETGYAADVGPSSAIDFIELAAHLSVNIDKFKVYLEQIASKSPQGL
ncbi:MAG TPA: DUF3536 domain-containing protein [Candidatus Omnitrophota bacterium]|nr:DUF3536 domain-containing protein [Candidatus Omnitrophota bacterium]HPD85607.1 DUF3536 domain-containing protein [Candidatus Omnitrophota bacterium]HRZ04535.1 DUF3536 domain-containing protein [Candidatus Omnitrophota bacterium]